MRAVLTLLFSATVCLGSGIVAIKLAGGIQPLVRALLLAVFFLTSFTVAAAFFRLSPRVTLAGLLASSVIFTSLMIYFDWALGSPATERLTVESFSAYVRLYRNIISLSALFVPSLATLLSFFAGRGAAALLIRIKMQLATLKGG